MWELLGSPINYYSRKLCGGIKLVATKLFGYIEPRAYNEDSRRKEYILNIFLVSIILLISIAIASSSISILFSDSITVKNNAVPISMMGIELLFFIILYALSRRGWIKLASYLLLTIIFILITYVEYIWGVDLPVGILVSGLLIFISGILIDTRLSFLVTAIIIATIGIVGDLEQHNIIIVNSYWRKQVWGINDTIVIAIIYAIIAVVSWLSNREIEKSLARARKSEAELKQERDSLEMTVKEKTREVLEMQTEKMTNLYRLAKFGKLSSGIFHDLINPLTAVSLNMEKLRNNNEVRVELTSVQSKTGVTSITEAADYVDKAVKAAKKLEDLVGSVKKQLSHQETNAPFSLRQEAQDAIDVLSHKVQKAQVAVHLFGGKNIRLFGNSVKFSQVALNLISNAIDAYDSMPKQANRKVFVDLSQQPNAIMFTVRDKGVGIPKEHTEKIFEPFFTTKGSVGIGIGLSIVKRIVEKDFGGSIQVASQPQKGTEFTIKIPRKDVEVS